MVAVKLAAGFDQPFLVHSPFSNHDHAVKGYNSFGRQRRRQPFFFDKGVKLQKTSQECEALNSIVLLELVHIMEK
jgi:hypothetical protein